MSTAPQSLTDNVSLPKQSGAGKITLARPDWVPESLFPFKSRWIEIDGARMHYVDEGRGPILLMIPGTPMWSFMYRHPIKMLRDQYRCIAVDLPGLGLSQSPLVKGKANSRTADLLQGFVKALDLCDFALVTHATAGPPSLEMAVRERDRIRGLVITNSIAWVYGDPKLRFFIRLISSSLFGMLNVNFNLFPRIVVRIGRKTSPFTREEKNAILGPYRSRKARTHLQNVAVSLRDEKGFLNNLESRLRYLHEKPTLFLYGTNDNGYKAGLLNHWTELLPNQKTVLLEHSAHFPVEDEPERYTGELRLWLQEQFR